MTEGKAFAPKLAACALILHLGLSRASVLQPNLSQMLTQLIKTCTCSFDQTVVETTVFMTFTEYQGVLFSRHEQSSEGNNDSTERNHEGLWEPR